MKIEARTIVGAALVLTVFAAASTSCTATDEGTIVLGGEDDAASTASFNPAPDSASSVPARPAGRCPTDECPPGRTTCPNHPLPCAVDLASDDSNCGACGNACPIMPGIHARARCMDGKCVLRCADVDVGVRYIFADCNGLPDDGCEARPYSDSNNCGACGVVCPENHTCFQGTCVCAIEGSCGACGNVCESPEKAFPAAWNAEYGCVSNQCNQPVCLAGFADCNGDFPVEGGDGCETRTGNDLKNCGGCGVACAPGEICFGGKCDCRCGSSCFNKLNYDVGNCGACLVRCQPAPNGSPTCENGVCNFRCLDGYADCDGDPVNGCEVDLRRDPLNCGACGSRCTGTDGQPCVDGQCATKECEIR